MKKISIIVILVGILIYLICGPFVTLIQLKDGIVEKDYEKISSNVDFVLLKANIKEQLLESSLASISKDLDNNLFASLASAMIPTMIENSITLHITPAGLVKEVNDFIGNQDINDKEHSKILLNEVAETASFNYNSINKFTIHVPTDKNNIIDLVLTRYGIDWKLSNIIRKF